MAERNAKRNYRPTREKAALDRFFEGLPVEEADAQLIVMASEGDAKGAERSDPANCALARACKRLYDSTAVLFFRTRAYIDLPNEKGKRVVKRFLLSDSARAAVVRFDRTGEFPPAGFVLAPPTKSQRLEYNRKQNKQRRDAVLRGEREAPTPNGVASVRGESLAFEGVRSGTGMVHFSPKADVTR